MALISPTTGRRRLRPNFGFATQAEFLPLFAERRQRKEEAEKGLALEEQGLAQRKELDLASIASSERIAREGLETTKEIEDRRRDQAASDAAADLEFAKKSAGTSALISGAGTAFTAATAVEKLSGGALSTGLKNLFGGTPTPGPGGTLSTANPADYGPGFFGGTPAVTAGTTAPGFGGGAAVGTGLATEAATLPAGLSLAEGGAFVAPGAGILAPLSIAAAGFLGMRNVQKRRAERKDFYNVNEKAFMAKERADEQATGTFRNYRVDLPGGVQLSVEGGSAVRDDPGARGTPKVTGVSFASGQPGDSGGFGRVNVPQSVLDQLSSDPELLKVHQQYQGFNTGVIGSRASSLPGMLANPDILNKYKPGFAFTEQEQRERVRREQADLGE